MSKIDLLARSHAEMQALVTDWNQPRYRADQVWTWIYRHLVTAPDEMANLPRDLRQRLAQTARVQTVSVVDTVSTDDGQTQKALLRTDDGETIEAVLMRYPERNTVCASTQAGCSLGCAFCATGQAGFRRDLTAGEISAQILHFSRLLASENQRVTNVVFMGMGEPMLNYDAVLKSIHNMAETRGLNMGLRHFTISTCGVVPGIERLAAGNEPIGLAVSLHAADDALRDRLVPMNQRYPIASVMRAVDQYVSETGRRPTFEYVLANHVNDSGIHAKLLARLLQGRLAHVNLIPLNPTSGCGYGRSAPERVRRFRDVLAHAGVTATVRISRGTEISAGCGQLRGQHQAGGGAEGD